ncbi:MAG: DUF108 domain-containing protein [Methanocorpusculum sp.]|nr:DUF108 domain-containing protein [Methanocorpusculum sp.]
MQNQILVSLLGCGSVASVLASHQNRFKIVSVYDTNADLLQQFSEKYSIHACRGIDELLSSSTDIVAENAPAETVKAYAAEILRAGKDLLLTSTALLADPRFCASLKQEAEKSGAKIRIPPGLLTGLDSIRICGTESSPLRLKITAPPEVFGISNSISPCIFSGDIADCAQLYPGNSHIAAALAAADGHEISVELWADPALAQIITELSFSGNTGEVYTRTSARISMKKPDEIPFLGLSALAVLENIHNPFRLGV